MATLIRFIFREGDPQRRGSPSRCSALARQRGLTLWREGGDIVIAAAYRAAAKTVKTQPAALIPVNFAPRAQSKCCLTAAVDNLPAPMLLPRS